MAEEAQKQEAAPGTMLGVKQVVEGDPNAAAAAAAEKAEERHLYTLEMEAKPEGIPDNFWDAEGKKLKIGAMHKALSDTQTALRNKQPKAPEKYETRVPEDLQGKVELDPGGDGLKTFNDLAKKHALSQDAYDAFLGVYLKEIATQAPDPEAQKAEMATHMATLAGPNYFKSEQGRDGTLAALNTYLSAHLDEEEYAALSAAAATPKGVSALNKLRLMGKETGIPDAKDTTVSGKRITEDSLRQMVADERYETTSPKHDPTYRAEVSKAFSEFYSNQ